MKEGREGREREERGGQDNHGCKRWLKPGEQSGQEGCEVVIFCNCGGACSLGQVQSSEPGQRTKAGLGQGV
jgi:hypothetical protein